MIWNKEFIMAYYANLRRKLKDESYEDTSGSCYADITRYVHVSGDPRPSPGEDTSPPGLGTPGRTGRS